MNLKAYMDYTEKRAKETLRRTEFEQKQIQRERKWLLAQEKRVEQERKEAKSTLARIQEVRQKTLKERLS